MRFVIFTHVEHKQEAGEYYAYAPYVREMRLWLKLVEEAEIIAPVLEEKPGLGELSYGRKYLKFTEIKSFHLLTFSGILKAIFRIPYNSIRIFNAMKRADHIHLRCPGNIGLLACILQVFFPNKPKTVKYAGNWDPEVKQPRSYKLQKWIVSNSFLSRNMKVLVYGAWPKQSRNITSFFTASFSEQVIPEIPAKEFEPPYTFLYAGNLVSGKRPLFAIKLVEKFRNKNFPVNLEIYGDGKLREELEAYVQERELSKIISFKGARPLEELQKAFGKAHFLVLASSSEGWPKAIAEAMFYGVLAVATPVSCIPWMLGKGKRGVLIRQPEVKQTGNLLMKLAQNKNKMRGMSVAAKQWSQQYTLEKFEAEIKNLLQ